MVCDINNRFGDNPYQIYHTAKNPPSLELVLATLCFIGSFIFLVVTIFFALRYLFLMLVCLCVGVMITDEIPKDAEEKEASR